MPGEGLVGPCADAFLIFNHHDPPPIFRRRSALRLVTAVKPSSNMTRQLFILRRTSTAQGRPFAAHPVPAIDVREHLRSRRTLLHPCRRSRAWRGVVPSVRAQVTRDEVHALAFSPIEKMSDVLIIPSIMLRRGQKWNGGYKLIVRLGATANKKERSCPRFLIVEFFGVRGDARSPL